MPEDNKIQLSDLLKDPDLERLSLELRTPNFFNVLGSTRSELKHSNFLAWLMSPNESHNLNTIFIKWFLRDVFSEKKAKGLNEFELDATNLHNIKVHREWRDIDILIEHEDFVVVIENKVDAAESEEQLKKYSDIVEKEFPGEAIKKVFVFLTVDGIDPRKESDANKYISIDYSQIKSLIEILLSVYKESLPQRVQYYIEDYLLILNRYIMNDTNDSVIKLAHHLYKNHKLAIDFIFDVKPDKFAGFREIIENKIVDEGYVLQTCNKYYARFLTKSLSEVIPKTGIAGWKGNESFLFEIVYQEKYLSLKFVISPGNEKNRQILSDIIKSLPESTNCKGKKWLTYYSNPIKARLEDPDDDKSEVNKLIEGLLRSNKKLMYKVEDEIINRKEEFE